VEALASVAFDRVNDTMFNVFRLCRHAGRIGASVPPARFILTGTLASLLVVYAMLRNEWTTHLTMRLAEASVCTGGRGYGLITRLIDSMHRFPSVS
jgi:hypothetical protein